MKKKIVILLLSILVIVSLGLYFIKDGVNSTVNKESIQTYNKNRDDIEGVVQPYPFLIQNNKVIKDIQFFGLTNLDGKYIYDNLDRLPEAQRKLFANNKDTTNYILGYLKNERVPFEYGETVQLKRKYPYYIQWDRRWAYDELGRDSVAIGGCGPTTVAMALSGLLNDDKITPKEIAQIEEQNGYYTPYGTSWSFFDFIAEKYNLNIWRVKNNKESIDNVLKEENPIILSVNPGRFTTVGHIVLITDVDSEGNYIINDPNSYGRTLKKWTYNELKSEIKAMWGLSKK